MIPPQAIRAHSNDFLSLRGLFVSKRMIFVTYLCCMGTTPGFDICPIVYAQRTRHPDMTRGVATHDTSEISIDYV